MKILRLFPNFQTELKYTEHYLARELSRDGHKTTFVSSDAYLDYIKKYIKQKDPAGYYNYEDYDLYRLKAITIVDKSIIVQLRKLYTLLFKKDIDVFHFLGIPTFTTVTALWLHFFSASKIPIIISDHSDTRTNVREGKIAQLYYFFFTLNMAFFLRRIHKIVTFSQTSVDLLSKRFKIPKSRFEIIQLGYDQNTYKYIPSFKNTSPKLIIGFAGKISKSKRIDLLMDTINQLKIKDNIKLIVVGFNKDDEYCQSLKKLTEDLDFEVELRPFATSNELVQFYNHIDLAVYPGGISITTIEASGCGTPVVIFKSIKGLEERVSHNRGLLFDTENELKDSIKKYYQQMVDNKIDNSYISQKTRELFSWEKISRDYLKLYKQAIDEK